jgi:hypothetical protein
MSVPGGSHRMQPMKVRCKGIFYFKKNCYSNSLIDASRPVANVKTCNNEFDDVSMSVAIVQNSSSWVY